MTCRSAVTIGAFLAWTLFVWGLVRVRNILGDEALTGSERVGPLVLSATMWVPALALAVALVVALVRHRPLGNAARIGVAALAVWTVLIWLVRAYDIAIVNDHEAPFIIVHLVLAAISIALAVLAARSMRPEVRERTPQAVGS
ncbi:hypothetical protein BH10ACT3_BH10ACT3_06910 [soil metagenome]